MLHLKTSVLSSDSSLSSSFDLIVLILFCGRLVLMKEIPGRPFQSHSSGNTLYHGGMIEKEIQLFFLSEISIYLS